MNSYRMGLVVGIAIYVVLFVVILIVYRKFKKDGEHYDERQNLARGKGYKLSFMTILLLNFFYSFFVYGLTKDFLSPQLAVIAIGFIGIAVYTIYCIFTDAYLAVGQKPWRWTLLILFVIAGNTYAAIRGSERGLIINGFATGASLNILIAITFSLILVAVIIKYFIDKKGADNEES